MGVLNQLVKSAATGRTERVQARADAWAALQAASVAKVQARQQGRAAEAQAKAEGGYWDPENVAARTDLATGLTTAAVQAGLAAATGGASLVAGAAGESAGGLLNSILGAASSGLEGLGAASPPPPPPPAPASSSNTGLLALGALALGALTLR